MEYVGHFKYLGAVIDNNLTFHQHVDTICKKLARLNSVIYQARKFFLENCS